jgi:hypothetical protein
VDFDGKQAVHKRFSNQDGITFRSGSIAGRLDAASEISKMKTVSNENSMM